MLNGTTVILDSHKTSRGTVYVVGVRGLIVTVEHFDHDGHLSGFPGHECRNVRNPAESALVDEAFVFVRGQIATSEGV